MMMSSPGPATHRTRLLAAARELLRERAYGDITARDLVAASSTNLGSIGYHFGSKEALLTLARAPRATRRALQPPTRPSRGLADRLGRQADRFVHATRTDAGGGPLSLMSLLRTGGGGDVVAGGRAV